MRTLVVGPRGVGKTTYCESLCAEQSCTFLNLDPARQTTNPLGTVGLFGPGMVPEGFRFIGTLAPHRDPMSVLSALEHSMSDDLVVELPISSVSAVAVSFLRAAVDTLLPEKIVSIGFSSIKELLQPQPSVEVTVLEPVSEAVALPVAAEASWRRALWKRSFEKCVKREVGLELVCGARIGSGVRLSHEEMAQLRDTGLETAQYAEIIGEILYIVISGRAETEAVTAACHQFECAKAHLAHPKTFQGLVCGFESSSGTHTAIGRISTLWEHCFVVEAQEFAFDSLWRLRLGRVRLGSDSEELGEIRSWQV